MDKRRDQIIQVYKKTTRTGFFGTVLIRQQTIQEGYFKMIKIKKITKLNAPEFTVDIEVENTHSYMLSNGWISHNTVSQLVDAASGIHPRHDPYYFRRVRSDIKDPLTKHLITAGIPNEPDVTKPDSTMVFTFPKKAPEDATMRGNVSAIDHLELWLKYQRHWCEHKPSVTISVKEEEWPTVGAWVWDHFDEMSGVSFLPYDGGTYRQAPYETVTKEQYEELLSKMPTNIDWSQLVEREDNVEGVQTLACVAGGCEI